MNITKKEFFEQQLDLTIPELAEAARVCALGDIAAAEHIFAEYMKKTIKPELFFKMPMAAPDKEALEVANNTLLNKYVAAKVPIDFGPGKNKVNWYANPTFDNYKEWPLGFHRHREWAALGEAYLNTGNEEYAEKYAELAYSWITEAYQCPKPGEEGNPHWRTLECGIRMNKSWNYAIHAFYNSPSVPDETWTLIFMSLWEQAWHVFYKDRGFNWLVCEKTGLLHVAILYPFFKDSEKWKKRSLDTLVRLCHDFVYPDNFEVELTTGYHNMVINLFLMAFDLFRAYNLNYPGDFANSARRMYHLYVQLVKPSLCSPNLNDGSSGSIVPTCQKAIEYFPEDDVLRYFATEFAEGKRPDYNSLVMPYSGILVMRTGFDPDDMWALFEAGPYGADHQHEDKLNFLLYAYGADMLPDSGNFKYDTSAMRKYVLSSRGHNTGLVDGKGQNRGSTYVRITPEEINIKSGIKAKISDEYEVGEGTYNEGYGPEQRKATHNRKVIWFKKGYNETKPFFVIIDDFSAPDGEEHFYESSWQLTDAPISISGNKVSATYKNGAVLNIISSVYPKVIIGQYEPEYIGWRADRTPEARVHIPAPVVSNMVKAKSGKIVTVLYPAPDAECPITDVKLADGGFEIKFGDKAEFFSYDDERFAADET